MSAIDLVAAESGGWRETSYEDSPLRSRNNERWIGCAETSIAVSGEWTAEAEAETIAGSGRAAAME
ncbi:MAG: hypothetical protein RLO01_11080 [Thalassobaculaceae bacterium]